MNRRTRCETALKSSIQMHMWFTRQICGVGFSTMNSLIESVSGQATLGYDACSSVTVDGRDTRYDAIFYVRFQELIGRTREGRGKQYGSCVAAGFSPRARNAHTFEGRLALELELISDEAK